MGSSVCLFFFKRRNMEINILVSFIAFLGICLGVTSANHDDDLAQASCVGMNNQEGWVYAVRKDCPGQLNCKQICESKTLANQDSQVASKVGECEMSLHVYASRPTLSGSNQLGPKVYRYRDCLGTGCGPNYCCCRF